MSWLLFLDVESWKDLSLMSTKPDERFPPTESNIQKIKAPSHELPFFHIGEVRRLGCSRMCSAHDGICERVFEIHSVFATDWELF